MSDTLNRTIAANDQIRAAVNKLVAEASIGRLKRDYLLARELTVACPEVADLMRFAAIKLLELIEAKEREGAVE